MNISQRELVAASLASTHNPDVYRSRPRLVGRPDALAVWRRTNLSRDADARPALAGVERVPESKRTAPEEPGRDGWGGASTNDYDACTCAVVGPDRFGNHDLVESATCPLHGWDEHPVMRKAA